MLFANGTVISAGWNGKCGVPPTVARRVNDKRQTSDSRLRFLKISNRYAKNGQNNSHVYSEHETTY